MSDQKIAIGRLSKEAKLMRTSSMENLIAFPSKDNIFIWYFVIYGLPDVYKHGIYMGKILFPTNYPFKPPDIMFITPNGRFRTNQKICMSFTSYHPESWANWSIEGLLIGLISFFVTDNQTTGAISTSRYKRKQLALSSLNYNIQNENFKILFFEYFEKMGINANNINLRENELKQLEDDQSKKTFFAGIIFLGILIFLYFGYKINKYLNN